jgi:hypothetical protein
MKYRDAIAFGMLGWMLMIPPGHLLPHQAHRNKHTALVPDATAPLNGWYPVETFSTEILCRNALGELSGPSRGRDAFMTRYHDPREHKFMVKALSMGQCIASDDPRVKGVQ